MRKKKHPEHVNHERWLVSYADFITLLFAFFVVMFAVSRVDSKQVGRFTESFSKAIGIDMFPEKGSSLLGGSPDTAAVVPADNAAPKKDRVLEGLKESLSLKARGAGGALQGLQVIQRQNDLVLRIPEGILFDSADDTVKPPAAAMLRAIAPELQDRPVDVRVEGHTDNRPIRTSRFPSNWELSTARSTAVLKILAKEKIDPERLSAAGYGEFRPIAPNDDAEGQKKNRRVDIVVTPIVPEKTEKAADKTNDKPADKPGDKPGDKPSEKPSDKPSEKAPEKLGAADKPATPAAPAPSLATKD